jgi:hypothetical protein
MAAVKAGIETMTSPGPGGNKIPAGIPTTHEAIITALSMPQSEMVWFYIINK